MGLRVRLSTSGPKLRAIAYQATAIAVAVLVGWYLVSNTLANLEARHIASGFGFLDREAGFEISEKSLVPYSAADTYLRALLVGLANTFRVALIGIAAATLLGTAVGLARLSRNWLVAKLAAGYVDFLRNVPLLVQLFFWYAIITENLPGPRAAIAPLPGVYLANRGVFFPVPAWDPVYAWMTAALAAGGVAALVFARWARRRQALAARRPPVLAGVLALLLAPPVIAWLAGGAPTRLSAPTLQGFNFVGGAALTPEFAALTVGLIFYTAARTHPAVRRPAAGIAAHRAAGHQPVPQPRQEQLARRGDRLPRPGVDRQHHDQSDRPGDRGHCDHHGGVPDDLALDLGFHELVQRADRAAG
jgi:general L-amino acid transport system permease protein